MISTNRALGYFLAGEKLELVQARWQRARGEKEREEGRNVGTFPSLPSTCLLLLAMVTCKHLLFLHMAMLVLGFSQLPVATLRVEIGDLQILNHQESSLVLQECRGKMTVLLTARPSLLLFCLGSVETR